MAAGSHFGFWPLLGLAHTFARGIGAQFVLNTSKYPNPLSNLPLLSVVTGGPNMTLLTLLIKHATYIGYGEIFVPTLRTFPDCSLRNVPLLTLKGTNSLQQTCEIKLQLLT